MPRIGTPRAYIAGSILGAPFTFTDVGPPEKMIPEGLSSAKFSASNSCETISL